MRIVYFVSGFFLSIIFNRFTSETVKNAMARVGVALQTMSYFEAIALHKL